MEPHNDEEFCMGSLESPGLCEDGDRTMTRYAAEARRGFNYGVNYVWDARAEIIRFDGYFHE